MTTLLIGELARECGLSSSALRFYDECGLLLPVDVDPVTGYRRYDRAQVADAELVRDLRAVGLPLARVKAFLALPPDAREELLDRHEQTVAQQALTTRGLLQDLRRRLTHQETDMSTTVDARDLHDALEHLLAISSADPEQPLLQTVLLDAQDGGLRLVATDRYRLSVRDLPALSSAVFTALLPAASVRRAVTSLASTGQGTATLAADERTVVLEHAGGSVSLPKVAAEFVDYSAVLDASSADHVLVAPREELLAVVQANDRPRVQLAFTVGHLAADDASLEAEYDGPGVTLLLDRGFLVDALRAAHGPDVALEASTPLRPLVVRSADTGTSVHLVMPIDPSR